MDNRCIPLLLAVVSAASLYGITFHRSFRNGYPAEAKSATVQGEANPLAQPVKGAGPSQGKAINDSDWQKGPTEQWFVNWDKALAETKAKNRPLFVLNTGSDWRRRSRARRSSTRTESGSWRRFRVTDPRRNISSSSRMQSENKGVSRSEAR